MPQEWPMWWASLVMAFGVGSFLVLWAIVVSGITRELRAVSRSKSEDAAILQAQSEPTNREPRGE